ncbi:NUDIX hydrolase domain-like protein [Xylaria nigripes]|nr:NUDIX hydrolase domain-like protein [Xylaria nigripes]
MASTPSAASTATLTSSATAPSLFASDPSIANFQVPLGALLETTPSVNGICVGAFVFDDDNRLLIIQRAAHDSHPLLWEIPGGSIDSKDETILHGLVRELWEETGMRPRLVRALVGQGYTFSTRRAFRVCKFSFFVDVESYNVRLDPNEHAAFLWVTEDEARMKKCGEVTFEYTTKKQEDAILEGFRVRREQGEGS